MTDDRVVRGVGVIAHLDNPSLDAVRRLAAEAEEAGADWLGVADAFWWRDTWMLLAEAARATRRIVLGPMVTNPYLRHPFHTASALATLQELAGPRVLLGLAAGGSEVSGAGGVSRRDAPRRIEALAQLVRDVAAGGPLDPSSGRRLDVPLTTVPIVIAGRGDRVLRAAGRTADAALLWAVPASDVERSAAVVHEAAAERTPVGLIWAPFVVHDAGDRERARVIAAYGVLNASPALRARWSVDDALIATIRAALVRGGAGAAAHLVPDHVVEDIAFERPQPEGLAPVARRIGTTGIAFPAYDLDRLGSRVEWARALLAALETGGRSAG